MGVQIARNLALNHVRDDAPEGGDGQARRVGRAATQELRVAIRQALAASQELDRDVFLLRETAGLSYDEIAGACELSVEAVRAG